MGFYRWVSWRVTVLILLTSDGIVSFKHRTVTKLEELFCFPGDSYDGELCQGFVWWFQRHLRLRVFLLHIRWERGKVLKTCFVWLPTKGKASKGLDFLRGWFIESLIYNFFVIRGLPLSKRGTCSGGNSTSYLLRVRCCLPIYSGAESYSFPVLSKMSLPQTILHSDF